MTQKEFCSPFVGKKFVEGRSEFISQMIYCSEVVGIRIFHDFLYRIKYLESNFWT